MDKSFGAAPFSKDVLSKANIGLWAFEMEEGSAPRMYADETMLGLLGLKEQIPPEEIYHAWYDHIDAESYDLVNDAVSKMIAGEHAEVQYPWIHPDGHTMIVRCGGERNFAYTKGVRIEGTHRDVTEVMHFDEKEFKKLLHQEKELLHTKLRADIFEFFINENNGPKAFFDEFSTRLRELLHCDQLLYRDIKGLSLMDNSPEIDKIWSVPIEYCKQCPHYPIDSPIYDEGVVIMDDCSKGHKGIPTYHKCPIKSSLTRIVYLGGEPYGYLAVHYLKDNHVFTEFEKDTLEDLARILSLSVATYKAQSKNEEYEQKERERRREEKRRSEELIRYFIQTSETTYSVNINTNVLTVIKEDPVCTEATGTDVQKPYASTVNTLIDVKVFAADREKMKEILKAENLKEKLSLESSFRVEYRQVGPGGRPLWFTVTAARLSDEEVLLNFTDRNEITLKKFASNTILEDYISVYYCNLNDNLITEVKRSPVFSLGGGADISTIDNNVKGLLMLADEEYRKPFLEFVSIEHVKKVLIEDSSTEFIYSSHITGSQRWVKCTLLVADRQNGIPVNLIMTFSNVDKEQVEKMKLNKEIAQLHVISDAFTESFISTFYVGLDDGSFEVYKRRDYYRNAHPIKGNFFESMKEHYGKDVHPDDREKMIEVMSPEYFKKRLETSGSFTVVFRDISEEAEKNIRFVVIKGADENHAAVGFMDITADIKIEQERMQAIEEARKANEASMLKSRFVQNISHDIRTPLNAIVGYSQLLGMPDGYLTPDEKMEFAEYISDSADMLTMLIDDVLSISDIENGVLNMQIAETCCNIVCMKTINCSQMRVQPGVRLHFTSEVDDNYTIMSDSKRVQQILVNFLSNACKHTMAGEIHLHFSLSENPGWATFSVTDTGTGVSPEMADKIFKRFKSLDNTHGSHGLGLDICGDLASRLGGRIGLDKSYTMGARFYLVLPLEK